MNIGPTTEPTADEVRLAADMVMSRLVRWLPTCAANKRRTRSASTESPTETSTP